MSSPRTETIILVSGIILVMLGFFIGYSFGQVQ